MDDGVGLTMRTVGRPIHVDKCDKPSLDELHRVQKLYIDELTRSLRLFCFAKTTERSYYPCPHDRIWNTYKDRFAKARRRELNIID
jgi:hypothetical protein